MRQLFRINQAAPARGQGPVADMNLDQEPQEMTFTTFLVAVLLK